MARRKTKKKSSGLPKELEGKVGIERGILKGGAREYLRCMEAIGITHANNLYRGAQISYDGGKTYADIEDTSESHIYLTVQDRCYRSDRKNEERP